MADRVVPKNPCPSRQKLSSYLDGTLSEEDLVVLANHLARCVRCQGALAEIEAGDGLIERLRGRAELPGDPECIALEAAARAIALRSGECSTETPNLAPGTTPDLAATAPEGRPFGSYVLYERLGRGGMGIVYRARDGLNRQVAIKMILAGGDAGSEEIARFRREGEATARLRHANIVQVYEFGEHEGRLYYTMELIGGGSLAKKLSNGPLSARAAAQLLATLARAVQAAHDRQIIHRDLKPSNVLLGADGAPRIGDFGLAKLLDAETDQTVSEAILGTPSYMAPEQARGENKNVGPPADVYALGAILYECLTGRPPFQAATRQETLDQVRTREPQPPSRVKPDVPRDLEAVCLTCLEKSPGSRYPSARALGEDLESWLRGEGTVVRPPRWPRRTWLGLRRRPRLTAVTTTLLLAMLGVWFAAWYYDPERPLKALEARLARGETVELIGDTGAPRWHDWLAGGDKGKPALGRDGTFTISSWSVGLVELMHDPQCDHYEVTAQVCHLNDDHMDGSVGIFFGYQRRQQADETFHLLGRLTFNDLHDDQDEYNKLPQEFKGMALRPAPGNRVSLTPYFIDDRQTAFWDRGSRGREPRLFKPATTRSYPWRTLVLEVAPHGLRAWWGEDRQEVEEFSVEDYRNSVQTYLWSVLDIRPGDPFIMELPTDYLPRTPLGLFVQNGSASFRRVQIKPLP